MNSIRRCMLKIAYMVTVCWVFAVFAVVELIFVNVDVPLVHVSWTLTGTSTMGCVE